MRTGRIGAFFKNHIRIPAFFYNKPDARKSAPRSTAIAPPVTFRQPAARGADTARLRRYALMAGVALAGAFALAALGMVARYSSLDFTVIAAALMALCGFIAYDIYSRRAWEQTLAERNEALARSHDRLVREVARNRNEIATLKESLAAAAHAAEAEGRKLPPGATAEARMLGAIVGKLTLLSDQPRAQIGAGWDEEVLSLEMAPPPPRALPRSALDDAMSAEPEKYNDAKIRDILRTAVRGDQIDVFVQPVVTLPQRKTQMIEVFARIRAGYAGHLPATRYMDIARAEGVAAAIDNLLLLRCLQMLRDTAGEMDALPCAINVTAATLHDSGFMNDLVAFLAQHRALAPRLIFELPQAEVQDIAVELAPVLSGLARLGCRFSMDRVLNRRLNIARLKAHHVRFIKLDAKWLIREGHSAGGIGRISHLKKQLDAAGIDLIVEKIENEQDLRELLDYSIDFGQGYLFAKPDIATARALSPRRRAA